MATKGSSGEPASARPTGTVTFLFSDVEGSTVRWERDRDAMAAALERHDALMRDAIEAHGGYIFKTFGDAFCAAFATASDAIAAALTVQRKLGSEDFSAVNELRVRIGIHTGEASERDDDYFGPALNRVARLMSIGHGGQTLLSSAARALVRGDLPAGASLVDLGSRRLKDLTQPEHVWQLTGSDVNAEFPPLDSLDARPNNLPVQVTPLIGRERDLEDVRALVGTHRLVTIAGSAGVGKTRVALQVGADLIDRFGHGVWFADLSPISEPELVASVVAKALSVTGSGGQRLDDAILDALKRKQLLLIIDNCEQVVDAAAALADAIHRNAPAVRILATARQALEIDGEAVERLPSLAVPDMGSDLRATEALQYGAIGVFVERARLADSHFVLTDEDAPIVADICRRLDGIPLALELAAAKMSVIGPRQLEEKLDQRFRVLSVAGRGRLLRQQTLRAAIDWSFDLLDERARALFRRLSVFSNGWTLRAATEICCDEGVLDEWDVLDVLSSLVDKSLVVAEPSGDERRYRMLNSMREYGLERLVEASEAEAIAGKHARFYAAFVRECQPLVLALDDVEWRRLLAPELDNVRAVIDRTIFRGQEPAIGLALLADLEWPELIATPQEALRWFERAVRLADAMPDEIAHARILRHRALMEWLIGHSLAQREQTIRRAVEVARSTNDPNETARALASLGGWHLSAARVDEAERAFAEAYGSPHLLSPLTTYSVLRLWAVSDLQRGELDLARQRFSEVVRLARPGSEALASALLNLGELEFAMGNVQDAREAARRARETYARVNSVRLVLLLSNLAAYALAAGDIEDARKHLRDALHLQKKSGSGWLAAVLDHHALFAALLGDHERAVVLVGFTDRNCVSVGDVRQRTERLGYERLMGLLARAFSADELAFRLSEGARLTEEQAIAHASAIHRRTEDAAGMPPQGE